MSQVRKVCFQKVHNAVKNFVTVWVRYYVSGGEDRFILHIIPLSFEIII